MQGMRPLSDPEIATANAAFTGLMYEARNRALFVLGLNSGLRVSELLAISVGDVRVAGAIPDRIYVKRKNVKGKVAGRSILLNAKAKAAIAAWLALRPGAFDAEPLFCSHKVKKGTRRKLRPITRGQARRIIEDATVGQGMPPKVGTHGMRKTFASKVYDKLDHDLVATQHALGHRHINSTAAYLSFREEEVDAAVADL